MNECPMCKHPKPRPTNKTCGNSACVSAQVTLTKARGLFNKRVSLYGEKNPWIEWESKQEYEV